MADERGTILLKWPGGEMGPDPRLNIAVSCTPASGTCTIDTFLWDGIHAQNALDANKSVLTSVI